MADAHKNFPYSTILTAPSPATSGTSLVVQSGDGAKFPLVPFNITIWPAGTQPLTTNAEIVRVTAISTDTFTIIRTQESTSARTVLVGDQIAATVTNKTLIDAEAAPNILINGNFDVWQRNTSATPNDDVYTGADRWNNVQETSADWTFARDTDTPDGSRYSMKLTNVTANAGAGIVTFLENADTMPLDDQYVSLSFWAKTNSTEIAKLRAGIITWGSTADVITSDVVGTWHSSAGTNPTLATNWTYENTPSDLALTSSWQQFKIENVLLDTATVNNLGIFIWVDDVDAAANDDVYIAQVNLNIGGQATPLLPRTFAEELSLCQRYCFVHSIPSGNTAVGYGWGVGTTNSVIGIIPPVTLRVVPTLTATASDWQLADSVVAAIDGTSIGMAGDPISTPSNLFINVGGVSIVGYRPYALRNDSGGTRTMIFDAEL